jgi:hypothetical protein
MTAQRRVCLLITPYAVAVKESGDLMPSLIGRRIAISWQSLGDLLVGIRAICLLIRVSWRPISLAAEVLTLRQQVALYPRAAADARADVVLLTSSSKWPKTTLVEPFFSWQNPYVYLKNLAEWKGVVFVPPPLRRRP